jgi:predicted dehydrogenase
LEAPIDTSVLATPSTPSERSAGTRVRVGVIGAGLIAQVMHLHYLRELADRYQTAILCDISAEAASASAARFGIEKTTTDWRDLLAEPIDAVLVLTAGSHAPMAIEAARAGKHVLVEKPMCFSTAEGRAMVDAAEAAKVTLMTGYNKRYDPAYLRFRDAASAMGDRRFMRVTTLESPFRPYVSHYPLAPAVQPDAETLTRLRHDATEAIARALPDADETARWIYQFVLLDTLVHEINAVRGVLGEPDRLEWVDLRRSLVTVMLGFGEVSVAVHWIDLPGIARYKMEFALYGPDRRLTLSFPSPFLRNEPTLLRIEEGEIDGPASRSIEEITSFESGFKRELVAFHASIVGGAAPVTAGIDGVRDVALCEAIVRSAATRQPVDHPTQLV